MVKYDTDEGTQDARENSSSSNNVHENEAKPIEIKVRSSTRSAAFVVDGKHIVCGDSKGRIRCWQVKDGKEVGTPMDTRRGVLNIAVSRDGKWVVGGTVSGEVVVWNAESHKKVTKFTAHSDRVWVMDISPDGTKITTGSEDKTICVWSLSTGQRLLGPLNHDFDVVAVKFSPDGRLIATSAQDRDSVRIYDYLNGRLLVDIEYAETCELDLMLQSCLLDCMADDQTMEDATSLFKKCLNLVLPICNGEAIDSKEIGKQLAAYCTAKYETELYSRFTRAVNTALICLRNLAIDGLRDAPKKDTDQLFFHVGHRQIAQSYQEQRSIRKPDVVLVSTADFKSDSATDSKRSDDADKSPKKNFQWHSVRAAVEFKYRCGLKAPLSTYTVQYTTPSHHASQKSTDGIEPENDSSATCSSERNDGHEAQSDRESGFVVSQSLQATTGKKRKAEGERSSHDALRVPSNQVSSSKRLRVENLEAEPKKVDADVQVGTYGADMFASHTARQHVFCLLITGSWLSGFPVGIYR
ncbi:WD40-repeat-containing domain protein [Lanmaoa asiatica]|nr:WD40-repeat-containing domain protein [Lanmaoa asiatica]